MKHSKFILSTTGFLLAIAGVVAAKTEKAGHHFRGAYITSNLSGTACVSLNRTVTGTKIAGQSNTLKTNVNSVANTVYTTKCISKLYTIQD